MTLFDQAAEEALEAHAPLAARMGLCDSGAAAGKVQKLTVSGIHNCCPQCTKGIQATLKKVSGVTGDTAKARMDSFEVTGDFDPVDLVKALNAAGFHCKVVK